MVIIAVNAMALNLNAPICFTRNAMKGCGSQTYLRLIVRAAQMVITSQYASIFDQYTEEAKMCAYSYL